MYPPQFLTTILDFELIQTSVDFFCIFLSIFWRGSTWYEQSLQPVKCKRYIYLKHVSKSTRWSYLQTTNVRNQVGQEGKLAMLNGTPRDSSIPIAFQHSKIRCWWCRLLPEVGLYLVFYSIYWNPYTYVQDPSRVFHDLQSSYSHELLISQIWMFLSCKSLPFEDPRMKKRVLQLLRVVIRFVVIKKNPPVVWNQTPKEFRHFRRLCYLMMSIDVVFFVLNWSPLFGSNADYMSHGTCFEHFIRTDQESSLGDFSVARSCDFSNWK